MLYLITFLLIGIAFAGISIKIILKKNGEFSGTCASANPFLNKNNEACGICGKLPNETECKKPKMNLN